MESDCLFSRRGDLSGHLSQRKDRLKKEIEEQDVDYVLNVSLEDLCQHLVSKYALEEPRIHEDDVYVHEKGEVDIDVSRDPRRMVVDKGRPYFVKGLSIVIAVPFNGDGELFDFRPSEFTYNPPRGRVVGQEIRLIHSTLERDPIKIKEMHTRELQAVKRFVEWIAKDVRKFNQSLESFTRDLLMRRKKKLLEDQKLVEALEIPIMRSADMPATFTIPSVRRKAKIERPKASARFYEPEPVLPHQEYEHILGIVYDMSLVMERSPRTFAKLDEEEIRDLFLVHLNGHYEGQATGETFNFHGKSDILIRHEDKNVLIAECKFWKGKRSLTEATDQLLGYSSWRDTKTAIFLFSKNKDFSLVLERADSSMKSHKCYKRDHNLVDSKLKNETTRGYVFHQPGDKNRELFLVVMAFNIPAPIQRD